MGVLFYSKSESAVFHLHSFANKCSICFSVFLLVISWSRFLKVIYSSRIDFWNFRAVLSWNVRTRLSEILIFRLNKTRAWGPRIKEAA